jgi:3-hydroxyacyl-CoA dehydrogenase
VPDGPPAQGVIIGAGAIGLSFAAAFSDAGIAVTVVETNPARRSAAAEEIASNLAVIRTAGLARGGDASVTLAAQASEALSGATLVLECGPEDLDIKRSIFGDLLERTASETLLATASSAIEMSRIVPDASAQARCFVAHPVNPPAVLRAIEIVPAPGTDPAACRRAAEFFAGAGFSPVILGREVEGFVMNRLQSAVLREAYRLVDEGVADVDGIDTIMRMALGPRWALSGPFETAELNTPGGIRAHAARMGPAYKRIGEGRGETVDWNDDLVARVETQRRALCPADALPARVRWRADAVARLIALRDTLMDGSDG